MAPCWILKSASKKTPLFFVSIVLASSILLSCGTTKKTTDKHDEPSGEPSESTEETTGMSDQLITQINTNRSNLDDVFATQQSEVPEVFRKESTAEDIGDPNEGYRVQILSTRNVSYADSVANDYRFWADDAFSNYRPKAYVLFRQPYYKVHIGNFQFHDQAMKLNQFLKNKYPDAWVVHDQIEPNLVPPDTTTYKQNGKSRPK